SVAASPIFVGKNGAEKEGSVTSTANLPAKSISEVRGSVYDLGGDYFYEVPTDGLVSIWTFSGDADDGWGSNDGTLIGGASIVDGKLVLDGSGDYVDCGSSEDFNFGAGDFSISAWMKTETLGTNDRTIIAKRNTATSYWHYRLAYGSNNMRLYTSAGTAHSYASNGDLRYTDGEWHNVVVVRDSGGFVIHYLDSELMGSVVDSFVDDTTNTQPVFIGTYNTGVAYPFNGSFDNVMVYGRVLTQEEVAIIYDVQRKS
ncbi:MAG: LamG domain-containing protein, partial [archaeon]